MKSSPVTRVAPIIACGTVFLGLLASSDSVEPQKRQAQDRRACQHRCETARGAVAGERRHQVDLIVPRHLHQHQHDERRDEDGLNRDDQDVGPRHRDDSDDVQHRDNRYHAQHDHPRGYGRQRGVEVNADDEGVDHREKQIIQQQRPAGQETDRGAKGPLRIGVCRACHRDGRRHSRVRQRGEHHRDQRHQVGHRQPAARRLGNDPVGGEHRERHHVHQPEQHQRGESERSVEMAFAHCLQPSDSGARRVRRRTIQIRGANTYRRQS